MKKNILVLLTFAGLAFVACDATKKAVATKPEEKTLSEITIEAPPTVPNEEEGQGGIAMPEPTTPSIYNPSSKRSSDLLHTKIDIRFDWAKAHALGKATLTLKPYFYATDELVLDAKNFDINSVTLEDKTPLKYDYDKEQLTIHLNKKYARTEQYKIVIDYVAKPDERTTGGSAAISSDKGLFFINPKGEEPGKPMQIWTQGETESNSCWMPTIDKPNERCTHEITMTVEDKYKTLSNGLLASSTKNADGTRTDTWKMNQPIAPYLFMMAVGDFAVVKDKWNGIDVDYYVEPKFEKDARAIFPHTPELLQFFSDRLGVKYPWQKYSQIVVRDYVSGAMENVSAVIFGDFMQKSARELIDVETNESVVAHEMFHHWFGDYVTCESWSNLTLNEGFANYSEYLWLEHKYGADAADYHRMTELSGYMGQARQAKHPLIYFGYKEREAMFDAHSYNKGGLILHQLRNYLGDEAFFTALNKYLTTNAYTSVEAHQLRMAFEEVSGEDLNWFFNQWFFTAGHPELEIEKNYDAATKKLSITIEQKQNAAENTAVYELPIAVDIYTQDGVKPIRQIMRTKERKQTFTFDVATAPKLVNIDADRLVLAETNFPKSEDELVFQYFNARKFADRQECIEGLAASKSEGAMRVLKAALNDKFWFIRKEAIEILDKKEASIATIVAKLAETDPRSDVRSAAISGLAETEDKKYAEVAKRILDKEQAYPVISAALSALYALDKTTALTYIKKLENEDNGDIIAALGAIYKENPSAEHLDFFEKNIAKMDGFDVVNLIDSYGTIGQKSDNATIARCLKTLKGLALNIAGSPWKRYGAARTLNEMRTTFRAALDKKTQVTEITDIIEELKKVETNAQLKTLYNMF